MKKGKEKGGERPVRESSLKSSHQETRLEDETLLTACERVSSERYQAFVENIDEGVYEVDLHGNFLYFNNALCRIFGHPGEEIRFQNFTKFMDEESVRSALETFDGVYQTGRGVSGLLWNMRDNKGKVRVIELSANLITGDKGEKIGFRGIVRDITDKHSAQKSLQKSERRLRTLLKFAPYPIVVFDLEGRVLFLNPEFTNTFGWTSKELEGKTIPYVPPGLEQETKESIERLVQEKAILRYETQRLTKDGRILDVVLRGVVFSETGDRPSGELVILRNITREKRIAQSNETLLRISMALPEYPVLDDLLDYISGEIKRLLGTEGALVILLDEVKNELFFKSASLEDSAKEKRMKEIRFPADKGISAEVIRTGKHIVVPDTSKNANFYPVVDIQAGIKTRNMLDVPLRNKDKIIGVLCATNKKRGVFDEADVELLNMIAGTVALSIEDARVSEELREAYEEVASLNRAKDKVLNHLSHELKTPLSILGASLSTLTKRLEAAPDESWRPTVERARRNLNRILEMQYQIEDILRDRHYETHRLLSTLLDICADELEALVADETAEGPVIERIRRRIDEEFCLEEMAPQEIFLHQFVPEILRDIRPLFAHRKVNLITRFESALAITMPADPLRKVVLGLIKNALENTPDEGSIDVALCAMGKGIELMVRDYGVGIVADNQRRIFEGFFTTQEVMDYSSKRPFDFNAGGKGADLLRMKIFSERYGFKIDMTSSRCPHIPLDKDACPGRISACDYCRETGDCHESGGTTFRVFFPEAVLAPLPKQA
ncbi:MAG: PAS domain S-box protein [Deltaproteobacteria bacterium]|nr:PAS domain S-box protein [Deltaproteobacteria bacterium]